MLSNTTFLYALSVFLAFIPAFLWLTFLLRNKKHKKVELLIFAGSILSVVPVFALQYFLKIFPEFDIVHFLQGSLSDQNAGFLIVFISVGVVEEIVKQILIRVIDRKYLLIQTVNESIHYSLVGALGFAFAENIFYIYSIYTNLGIQQLFVAYIFRATFTTCAHLLFSGFFGYYYGIAKFSLHIVEQSRVKGKKQFFTSLVSKIFHISQIQVYKELTIFKGFLLAMTLHATFNFLLQMNLIIPVVGYVVAFWLLLRYMQSRQSGQLVLVTDIDSHRTSSMAKKDEDVVIELLGMWFNEKKYVDVIHICQRLLMRDPDNKIVQLFKAQAMDKIESKNVYGQILGKLFPQK